MELSEGPGRRMDPARPDREALPRLMHKQHCKCQRYCDIERNRQFRLRRLSKWSVLLLSHYLSSLSDFCVAGQKCDCEFFGNLSLDYVRYTWDR